MQPIDFVKVCQQHHISYVTEGHKHCRPGWVNIACPFCHGNAGYHLGYELSTGRTHCWRCGGKRIWDVLMKRLHISLREARTITDQYQGRPSNRQTSGNLRAPVRRREAILPPGCGPMADCHKQYLERRKYDPDQLAATWGLLGTGPVGPYKLRVIIPIHFQNVMVSFQGRDITNQSPLKYKACSKDKEARDHKTVLYGLDKVPGSSVVIVEGVPSVWRLGPGSVATFGIEYTAAQVGLLRQFSRRYILFDAGASEGAARAQSLRLATALSAFDGITEVLDLGEGDPGDVLTDSEAEAFMVSLGVYDDNTK